MCNKIFPRLCILGRQFMQNHYKLNCSFCKLNSIFVCKEAVKMHVKHHFILKYFITKIQSHLLLFKLEVLPCNIHMLQVLNSYNNDMNNTIIMNKVCMLYYFKVFELNFVEFNNIKEPFDVFSGLERSFAHSSLHTPEGYL